MTAPPMRILAFVPTLGGGGAEKHVERIATAVPRALASIGVAVVRRGGSYERFLAADVEVVELRPRPIHSGTLEMIAALPALRRAMASGRWDALIAFLDRPSLAALAVTATLPRALRPALILSVQADPEPIFEADPLGPLFRFSMARLFRHADAVIAISEGVARSIRSIAPELAPRVIPNACVDEPIAAPFASTPVGSRPPVVVACGRLTPQKGFDVLLDAFTEVLRRVPSARLRILGEGPLAAELRARAERNGITASVEFVGFVDRPDEEFRRARVFCLSSRFEGLGMVVVEAMASGTPVVATDCPHGPREILEDGRNGWLVPMGDVRALSAALVESLTDAEKAGRFADLGAARARSYESSTIARRYVEAVREVLASRSESSR